MKEWCAKGVEPKDAKEGSKRTNRCTPGVLRGLIVLNKCSTIMLANFTKSLQLFTFLHFFITFVGFGLGDVCRSRFVGSANT